jgi:hypothetical protein
VHETAGDFDIRITVHDGAAGRLASFATRRGLRFLPIVLDRGVFTSQPTLVASGHGSPEDQRTALARWTAELREAGIYPCRFRIEAAQPGGTGYFEHRIKLRLPEPRVPDLVALTELVTAYAARLSRTGPERFVTQRCPEAGPETARARLDALLDALRANGHEILDVERRSIVYDSNPRHDRGWLDGTRFQGQPSREDRMRSAPAGTPGYPPTYQPFSPDAGVYQRAAFDPALKHYRNAYRAGEPVFLSAEAGLEWTAARRAAMAHVLTVIAGTVWGPHLVLRGSVTMAAWAGDAAREPGDLDFVVTPPTIPSTDPHLIADLKAALRNAPGAGLRPDDITEAAIWTYERADGHRLVVPFRTPAGLDGHVQVDLVFGERMPLPYEMVAVPGVAAPVRAAPAALALAWKLLWLATDRHPQGKDLYDAVLLAEHTTAGLALVRDVLRPELLAEADEFTAGSVLAWEVDWVNFADEYPGVAGTGDEWTMRLALALDRAWSTR